MLVTRDLSYQGRDALVEPDSSVPGTLAGGQQKVRHQKGEDTPSTP